MVSEVSEIKTDGAKSTNVKLGDFDLGEVSGIGEYFVEELTLGEGDDTEKVLVCKVEAGADEEKVDKVDSEDYVDEGPRAFLVVRKNTLEVRTDAKLRDLLREKYESVMVSRYFGKGGIEIVNSGQLKLDEIYDLVRLSYRLSEE